MPRTAKATSRSAAAPRKPRLGWTRNVAALRDFQRQHGHCNVPAAYRANPRLAHFVMNTRRKRKLGRLPAAQVRELTALGFCWQRCRRPVRRWDWSVMLAAWSGAGRQPHHGAVPAHWPTRQQIDAWVHRMRRFWRLGQLDPERKRALDRLGFVWRPYQQRWEQMYAKLCAFVSRHGHCDLPDGDDRYRELAEWVRTQRMRQARGQLSDTHQQRLNAIGFPWQLRRRVAWEQRFAELEKFARRHGHCRVSTLSQQDAVLAAWVKTQRLQRRQGLLSDARIRQLDGLNFIWEVGEHAWWEMFAALRQYKARFGNCNVPIAWDENRKLANWVRTQRSRYRAGRLELIKAGRLSALGFCWMLAPLQPPTRSGRRGPRRLSRPRSRAA